MQVSRQGVDGLIWHSRNTAYGDALYDWVKCTYHTPHLPNDFKDFPFSVLLTDSTYGRFLAHDDNNNLVPAAILYPVGQFLSNAEIQEGTRIMLVFDDAAEAALVRLQWQ